MQHRGTLPSCVIHEPCPTVLLRQGVTSHNYDLARAPIQPHDGVIGAKMSRTANMFLHVQVT